MAIRKQGELRERDRVRVRRNGDPDDGREGVTLDVLSSSARIELTDDDGSTRTRVLLRDDLRRLVSPKEMVAEMREEQPEVDAARASLRKLAVDSGKKIEAIKDAAERAKVARAITLVADVANEILSNPTPGVWSAIIGPVMELAGMVRREVTE